MDGRWPLAKLLGILQSIAGDIVILGESGGLAAGSFALKDLPAGGEAREGGAVVLSFWNLHAGGRRTRAAGALLGVTLCDLLFSDVVAAASVDAGRRGV